MVNSKVSCMRHHFVLDISIYFPFQRELFHSLVQKNTRSCFGYAHSYQNLGNSHSNLLIARCECTRMSAYLKKMFDLEMENATLVKF